MKTVYVITHPEVVIDPNAPVPRWPLSELGRKRMTRLVDASWLQHVTAVYSSDEQKAVDGAKILADHLSLPVIEFDGLEEVDRSSTGYMPEKEHDRNGRMLFLYPEESIDGWERAVDAQKRMVDAVTKLIKGDQTTGDLVIVTHGAVGSFLNSHLKNRPINLDDTPGIPGGGGIFAFDAKSKTILYDWLNIDDVALYAD